MCEIKLFFGLLIISWFKFTFMAYYFIQKKAECVCVSRCKCVFSQFIYMKVERGKNSATGSDWDSRHPVISEHVREPLGHDSNSNAF